MRAEANSDPAARADWLGQAVASVQQSLEIKLQNQNQVGASSSYAQLSVLYQKLGDLDAAQQNMLQALAIHESLNHPDVWKDYSNLADIARARGDAGAAAEWQAKRDAKRSELDRLERGEATSAPRVDKELIKYLNELAQACYAIRARKQKIPLDLAEVLAQLQAAQPPFPEIGAFLHAIAAGSALPSVPAGLPREIKGLLEALREACLEL
jgi:hypothetical protein